MKQRLRAIQSGAGLAVANLGADALHGGTILSLEKQIKSEYLVENLGLQCRRDQDVTLHTQEFGVGERFGLGHGNHCPTGEPAGWSEPWQSWVWSLRSIRLAGRAGRRPKMMAGAGCSGKKIPECPVFQIGPSFEGGAVGVPVRITWPGATWQRYAPLGEYEWKSKLVKQKNEVLHARSKCS